MKFNPLQLMQLKPLIEKFKVNHPKVPLFLKAIPNNIQVDSILEISVTDPQGKKIVSNIKVKQDDMELMEAIKNQFLKGI